jgi:hypothetical protein
MSDYRAAQIIIGGCLSRALVPGLCTAIRLQQVALDWGDEPFLPQSAEELLAARRTIDGEHVLRLLDAEARHGRLEPLEAFLRKRRIPFDLQIEAGFNGGESLTVYRPEVGECSLPLHEGELVTAALPIWEFADTLAAFRRQLYRGPRRQLRQTCDEVMERFQRIIPNRPSPLPAFEIGKSFGLRHAA